MTRKTGQNQSMAKSQYPQKMRQNPHQEKMRQNHHPEKNRFDWKSQGQIPRSRMSGMPRSNPNVQYENAPKPPPGKNRF